MRADLLMEMLEAAGQLAKRLTPKPGEKAMNSRYYRGERLQDGLAELRRMGSMRPGQIVGRGV